MMPVAHAAALKIARTRPVRPWSGGGQVRATVRYRGQESYGIFTPARRTTHRIFTVSRQRMPTREIIRGGAHVPRAAVAGCGVVHLSVAGFAATREVLTVGILGALILLGLFWLCFLFIDWEDRL